ncbi:MAG: hypothetical protein JRJ25_11280 [Deltaproteobacteria bacterium]|nr:hypothetical protein [Deltaproteobacteria bacterium]
MRKSIKEAIGTTIQDMLDSGFQSSFTKKELNSLGVKIPDIVITSAEIKAGSTKVLLELLNKSPHLLNYRIGV